MVFTRTTPARPVDMAAVFPELAPLARAAVRLHPRPGSPSAGDSSVGGPLLWPAGEAWPHCGEAHVNTGFRRQLAEERLERRIRARRYREPDGPELTPEETAAGERNAAARATRLDGGGPPPSERPVPLLPVAQLYLRDVPLLATPGRADLLQVLWCPYEHGEAKPMVAVFWRTATEVRDPLVAPPEPFEADWPGYVPEPCLLAPETVTEYPDSMELSPELRRRLEDPEQWRTAGAAPPTPWDEYPEDYYRGALSWAPGWKVGGWAPWGRTDPYPQDCAACGARMTPLLTIASFEWDGDLRRDWAPAEDREAAYADSYAGVSPAQPTQVEVGSTDNMQLYVCPADPGHPHVDLIQ
ncbi:hypothetical protein [Streptomyces sp. NPDC097619]|uniref:hypothetical protein n=1 Tax=Streptomyces sp. NPDC097619 TaxID=3157228 RepID=UPI003320AE4F